MQKNVKIMKKEEDLTPQNSFIPKYKDVEPVHRAGDEQSSDVPDGESYGGVEDLFGMLLS